jgi:ABC-type antimicrobial peptide transport system permease subunit
MSQTGVGLHRPFVINVLGGLVPVEVIGTVIYFPTLDPERGPFAVTDVDALIDFIELRGHRKTVPNELFASLEPTDFPNEEIGQQVRKVFRLARIDLRAERIVSTFIDPIAVAGWRGMSIVATIVAGLVVLMAYAVFMAAFALRTKGDVALKLALGASTRDQWLSTVAELFPAIFVGAVVGLGTGFAVSSLMVGSMAYTDTGAHLLPPFILQTNWMLPVVTIAAIFTIALAGVVNSVRSLHEIQIAEMAREGFSAASI